jgi:hypothetical protein
MNLVRILCHVFAMIILILGLFHLLLLTQLLSVVSEHNLHIKLITATFLLIEFF